MQVTRSSRRQLQLQNLLFLAGLLVLVGLLAWLSTRYSYQADWTSSGRNTLSVDSRKLLDEMPGPIHITAFAREAQLLRDHIVDLVARYLERLLLGDKAAHADAGGIENVMGTSTATAMVAVSPGSEPMMVPAITPPRAIAIWNGVSAASRYSIPGMALPLLSVPCEHLGAYLITPASRAASR